MSSPAVESRPPDDPEPLLERDPTPERAAKIVWTLAWPAVALNSLQTINSLLDAYFVQHLENGAAAMTAMGSLTAFMFLFGSMTMMMGTASTAFVARFFGAKEEVEMRKAARQTLSVAFYLGLILLALATPGAYLAADKFVPDSSPEAKILTVRYLQIFALGLPALNLIQALAGCLRGIGDTKSPMYLSGAQIILHILLNYMLIGPGHQLGAVWLPGANWGMPGAAAALTISSWTAALIYLWWTSRTELRTAMRFPLPSWDWTRRILKIAIPSGFLNILRVTSLMAFTLILKEVPQNTAALAAIRPAFSIESMAFMPAFGLAVSAAALVGQSLGMKDPDRANRLAWTAGHHAAGVSMIMAIILFVFASPIAHSVLSNQPAAAEMAAQYIRFIALTEVFFAYGMVMIGGMQGAGDTVVPLWLTFAVMWCVRVPLAAFFALDPNHLFPGSPGMSMGADGCWLAMSATQLVQGIASMVLFKLGRWRTVKI